LLSECGSLTKWMLWSEESLNQPFGTAMVKPSPWWAVKPGGAETVAGASSSLRYQTPPPTSRTIAARKAYSRVRDFLGCGVGFG
jgi:hypothetical protein